LAQGPLEKFGLAGLMVGRMVVVWWSSGGRLVVNGGGALSPSDGRLVVVWWSSKLAAICRHYCSATQERQAMMVRANPPGAYVIVHP
jgi:hypothetical protein